MDGLRESILAGLFGPDFTGTADWIAILALAAALLIVLVRSFTLVRVQTRQLDLQEGELELQRRALAAHAMVNISDAEGRITYVNDNLMETTGFSAQDLLGTKARDVLLVKEAMQPGAVFAAVAAGKVWSGESQMRRKDGGMLWTRTTIVPQLSSEGKLVKAISLRTDITESKLRREEGPIRAMFDQLQDEVYVFGTRDFELHYLNKRAREFHGWTEDDYRDRTIADTTESFEPDSFRARVQPVLDGEIEAMIYESHLNGRPVEINIQLEHGWDGAPRFVAVVRDITQRKQVEQARSAFVATVSHELRAPLTSVKGALKLISSGATGTIPDKPKAMLGLALRNVDRLIELINDLLDLEKLDAEHGEVSREPLDMVSLVTEAIAANDCYGEEFGVRLKARSMPASLPMTGDKSRLLQVMTNLMSNAIKFSREGGEVEVGLEDHGDTARISVTDHGIGIPYETQPRLFERFVQADTEHHRKHPGTGLGLSIVKSIVEKHGGRIHFVSEPNVGTTFYVELPKQERIEKAA